MIFYGKETQIYEIRVQGNFRNYFSQICKQGFIRDDSFEIHNPRLSSSVTWKWAIYVTYAGIPSWWVRLKVAADIYVRSLARGSETDRTMAIGRNSLLLLAAAAASFFFCATLGQQQNQQGPVSELCLGCICEAVSNCNRSLGCNGDVCGLFRITWAYWADAGKPVIAQDHPDNEGAYARCVTEPYCAASTVQGYMTKFGKDCNGDGIVNCFDYAAIHRLGGYGCSGALDYNYQNNFMNCQRQVQQLAGGK